MKVFVTGATGFIGSRIVPELLQAGHTVIGLTRSEEGAKKLAALGAESHRGDLENPEILRTGAARAEGVIHCAFDHDFSRFQANCEKDERNIAALGDALVGTKRPLLITSSVGIGSHGPGTLATEDHFDEKHPNPRIASEYAGMKAAERGVNVSVVRLPQVHDTVKAGLVSPLVDLAREKKVSAYIDQGKNQWSAAHVLDVARLYRLALERAEPGSRYNAVAEEGIPLKEIAEAIGRSLGVPVKSIKPDEASSHFAWLSMFAKLDLRASSEQTRRNLNWKPTGPGLIEDLKHFR